MRPIIVRPAAGEGNENYTIVAGNRRFNACKALGWMEIPSRIVEADDNGKTSPDKSSDLENVVKEQRVELEKNSGIQTSIQPQDIKQYFLEVLQEVDKHKSTK